MRFCLATSFALVFLVAIVSGQAPNTSPAQPQGPASQTQRDARGNATAGKALYTTHQCWACHGSNGETDVRFIQENGTFIRRLQTAEEFVRFIRAPRPNEPPPAASSKSMPSYGVASLSDREAADLWAYIRTFKPTQPALKDIPLLNQMLNEGGKLRR
jgi:mono/diheme cytochrome c family protein